MRQQPGYFISVEGIEGVGKTTAVQFLSDYLNEKNLPLQRTREPGGTPLAEAIRALLLQTHAETMQAETELLLFFAARAQHLAQVIKPALAQGKIVLSDRFTDATYAYQGGGRGFDAARIAVLEDWVQAGLQPDLTLLLDAPVAVALARLQQRGQRRDRIEAEKTDFFTKIRHCYQQRAQQFSQRYCVIDANQSLSMVKADICQVIDDRLAHIQAVTT